jgi:hypothetical protein
MCTLTAKWESFSPASQQLMSAKGGL